MRIGITLIAFVAMLCVYGCTTIQKTSEVKSQLSSKMSPIEAKVDSVLRTMTLEDKVGEMTQLSLDMISVGSPYNLEDPHQLDKKKLREIIVNRKVGSILNTGAHALPLDHWNEIIKEIQDLATKEKSTGIPVVYGIDAIHGTNYTVGATLFPQQIGLAATFNTELVKDLGALSAYETRASYIPWNFSPVLDIGRDPRWPRFWETFGEDVHLLTEMGTAMIAGYQGDDVSDSDKVACTMKHFLGYSMTITGKDRTAAWIPESQLREYFLPGFKAAIEAGAKTIMINSGELNGMPVHCNEWVLTDLLKDELGFQGVVLTDWEDIHYLHTRHRVAKDYKEAIKKSINAGIDMSMVPNDVEYLDLLIELVNEGEVSMDRINDAAARSLRLKFELGLFDEPYPTRKYPDFASEKHRLKALAGAEESLVLLKNEENLLPLKEGSKIVVAGPTAHMLEAINGGWTNTWQGNEPKYHTKGKHTIVEFLQKSLGKEQVSFVDGFGYDKMGDESELKNAAQNADVLLLCLGEHSYTEKLGDLDDLNLPQAQLDLVKAAKSTGKKVILLLLEGRPRIVRDAEKLADAILLAMLPGNEGAEAIANVLTGKVNPSGKLPFTYPKFANTLLTYDHKGTDLVKKDFSNNAFDPQWEFGFGLSYSKFEYSNLTAEYAEASKELNVQVEVKNTSGLDGKETILVFVQDKVASMTPSVKRLRSFKKMSLKAGETTRVEFSIPRSALRFVNTDNKWVFEPGAFEVHVEKLSKGVEIDDKI